MTTPINQSELEAITTAVGSAIRFHSQHCRDVNAITVLMDSNGEVLGSIDMEDGHLTFFPGQNTAKGLG